MAYDYRNKIDSFVVEALMKGANNEKDVYDYVEGYIQTTLSEVRNTLSMLGLYSYTN